MGMENSVGWQPNPDRRGTLDIIWGCLFTILACTWTIQYPNLPAKNDLRIKDWARKCFWMLLNVVIPEFLLAQAISERRWAYDCLKQLREDDTIDQKRTWYGSMKEFVKSPWLPVNPEEPSQWTVQHCYYGNMGGFVVGEDRFFITMDTYLKDNKEQKEWGVKAKKPPLRTADIEDRDKGDLFTKIVALAQIIWLCISLIARFAQHMACAQLEILTSAFATCAFITYVVRWDKPKNVKIGTPVKLSEDFIPGPSDIEKFRELIFGAYTHSDTESSQSDRITEDAIGKGQDPTRTFLLLMVFMIIIGGVHLFAWDFRFPTLAEKMLWRIACSVATGLPAALFIIIALLPIFIDIFRGRLHSEQKKFMDDCLQTMKRLKVKDTRRRHPTEPYRNLEWIKMRDKSEDYSKIFSGALLSTERDWVAESKAERGSHTGSKAIDPNTLKVYLDALQVVINDVEELRGPKQFGRDFLLFRKLLLKEASAIAKAAQVQRPPNRLRYHLSKLSAVGNKTLRTNNFPRASEGRETRRKSWIHFLMLPTTVIYLLARLCIIAVAFSTLRAMPASVYQTTWAKYFPYLD